MSEFDNDKLLKFFGFLLFGFVILLVVAYYKITWYESAFQTLQADNARLLRYNNQYESINDNLTIDNQNLTSQLSEVAKSSNIYKGIADEFVSELINTKCRTDISATHMKISKNYMVDCDEFYRTNGTYIKKVTING